MSVESVISRQSPFHRLLMAALLLFAHDPGIRGGAEAWTYTYSLDPNRKWVDARQWCRDNSMDMAAAQNQEEINFLNHLLPFNAKYYWIGVHKVAGVWTWAGIDRDVPGDSQHWAAGEPDGLAGQDCVELYVKREADAAKWNNEKCHKKKGTVCRAASCTRGSCSAHADCAETVGNHTCRCHPGFTGPRCDDATSCEPLAAPKQGFYLCSDPFGSNRFSSRCQFSCELGFRLVGASQSLCQASGSWSHPAPACRVKTCSPIFSAVPTIVTCVDPVEPFSFGSQCNFTCREGYDLHGGATLTCLASGQWSRPTPRCAARVCPLLVKAPPHGRMNCSHPNGPFSYGSRCDFACREGFSLRGPAAVSCGSSGLWSQDVPSCQPLQCDAFAALSSLLSMNCSHPLGNFSLGSRCVFTCRDGLSLNGTEELLCTSGGLWNDSLPTCTGQGAALLLFAGVGSASVVPPVLIALALLILRRCRKPENKLVCDVPAWDASENPAFEF